MNRIFTAVNGTCRLNDLSLKYTIKVRPMSVRPLNNLPVYDFCIQKSTNVSLFTHAF